MENNESTIQSQVRAPRAGAIAGILFSVLIMTALLLIWSSVPADPRDAGGWLEINSKDVVLALNLMPFAGIAFLWFIGVLRDRVHAHEDRFFATVFLGSGILFLAMLFTGSAVAGSVVLIHTADPEHAMVPAIYALGRILAYQLIQIYGMKMAGVFMISTSTIAIRTGILPRWMAILGYALALTLILSLGHLRWAPLVFPLWVLMISIYVLFANLKTKAAQKKEIQTRSSIPAISRG